VELGNPHRSADVVAEVVVAERPLIFAVGVVFGVGLSEAVVWAQASERCRLERVTSLEYVVAQELVEPSVEGFGPTSGHYVDHAAGIAAELRVVGGSEDFEFRNSVYAGLVEQRRVGAGVP